MPNHQLRIIVAVLFISSSLLINIPYSLLIANFGYPDILREDTGVILTQFAAGGDALIWTWFAFAWTGLPLVFGILLLPQALGHPDSKFLGVARTLGMIGAIAQLLGLLRWVFVVPVLAKLYVDPAATDATKAAATVVFQAIHQYGGVVLGEHIGQVFTILWMLITSIAVLKGRLFTPWLGWFGIASSLVYVLAQTELLATVMPSVNSIPNAGLIGSLLWLVWMIFLGVCLIVTARKQTSATVFSTAITEGKSLA